MKQSEKTGGVKIRKADGIEIKEQRDRDRGNSWEKDRERVGVKIGKAYGIEIEKSAGTEREEADKGRGNRWD